MVRSILERREDLCMNGLKNTIETYGLLEPNPPPFQSTAIDRDPHWYTRRVKEAIHMRLHPDNINRDSGIEIPAAWMLTIKQHNSRSVPRRTPEGTISSLNDEDRNPPINNSLREDRNAPINTNQGAIYSQLTPSPDEDQQYSGRNVAIHI